MAKTQSNTVIISTTGPGESFSYDGQTYQSDANGFAEVPAECIPFVTAFGFVMAADQAAAAQQMATTIAETEAAAEAAAQQQKNK